MASRLNPRAPIFTASLFLAIAALAPACATQDASEARMSKVPAGAEARRAAAADGASVRSEAAVGSDGPRDAPGDAPGVIAAPSAGERAVPEYKPAPSPPAAKPSPGMPGAPPKSKPPRSKRKHAAGSAASPPPTLTPAPEPTLREVTKRPRSAQQWNGGGVLTAGTWDDNVNFDFFSAYRETLYERHIAGLMPIRALEHSRAMRRAVPSRKHTLDISLVIDTTGSMGDEIAYLQREFMALSSSITERYPRAEQRWSLVAYRDQHDDYVVRSFEFSDDPEAFRNTLNTLSAGGGGDFPEAPEQGLSSAAELGWRSGRNTAKMVFWVADAPHHQQNAGAMAAAIRSAQERNLHIYPVASSGIDELTELTMRSAAQLTGGRYIFLTDDSGVGGAHKEPTVPCYFVTKLNDAILRMVDVELSGRYRTPYAHETIRTGGNPQDRTCSLRDGRQVRAY